MEPLLPEGDGFGGDQEVDRRTKGSRSQNSPLPPSIRPGKGCLPGGYAHPQNRKACRFHSGKDECSQSPSMDGSAHPQREISIASPQPHPIRQIDLQGQASSMRGVLPCRGVPLSFTIGGEQGLVTKKRIKNSLWVRVTVTKPVSFTKGYVDRLLIILPNRYR